VTAAGFFGLTRGDRSDRIVGVGAGSRTNVAGAITARAAGTASTGCARGRAAVTATATTSVAAATRAAVPPSRLLPHASIDARLGVSENSSWSAALRTRAGGITGSFGRGLT
jgi:hypothetical protein